MKQGEFTRCDRGNPCPLCGATKYCSFASNDDRKLIVNCMNTEVEPPGYWCMKLHSTDPKSRLDRGGVFQEGERPKRRGPTIADIWKSLRSACSVEHAEHLAEHLGLPVAAINTHPPGWAATAPRKDGSTYTANAWAWPEVDGALNVVGIGLRFADGRKGGFPYPSQRGLVVPPGFFKMPDPVLIVEGYSDVLALRSIGLTVVGRPSDAGGVAELIVLLRERDSIILAESDPNKVTGAWPGRDSAERMAEKLALAWGRPVRWSMNNPDGMKDPRSWVSHWSQSETLESLGARLLAHVKEHARYVRSPAGDRADGRHLVANIIDTSDKGKPKKLLLEIQHIRDQVLKVTDGWPRRCKGVLFTGPRHTPPVGEMPDPEEIRYYTDQQQLFAMIHEQSHVRWVDKGTAEEQTTGEKRSPVSKGEFFASLKATATPNYETIEALPHHPPLANSYYLPMALPQSDGSALAELAAMLNPETEEDRDLLIAMFLTFLWGGPPGLRPAFVLMSEHGIGSGKSKTVEFLAALVNGWIGVDADEKWRDARPRLLDEESLTKRVVLIDNLKRKLSGSGIESAITSPVIDGKRMYVGQFSRPNTLTWVITANDPSLGADLSDRAIVIKIGKPVRDRADFDQRKSAFIANRRADVIADGLARLERGPVVTVESYDRWGPWIDAILRTFPNAQALRDRIDAHRREVNEDLKDAERIAEVIESMVSRQMADVRYDRISFTKGTLHEWLLHEQVIEKRVTRGGLTKIIKRLSKMEPLLPLDEQPGKGNGRCWLWTGPQARPESNIVHLDGVSARDGDDGPPLPGIGDDEKIERPAADPVDSDTPEPPDEPPPAHRW